MGGVKLEKVKYLGTQMLVGEHDSKVFSEREKVVMLGYVTGVGVQRGELCRACEKGPLSWEVECAFSRHSYPEHNIFAVPLSSEHLKKHLVVLATASMVQLKIIS